MTQDDEVKLKVCESCDAPLPFFPKKINYFKKNDKICDDCLSIKK